MKYIECTLLTTTQASDAVSYILEDEGAVGVMIEDVNDFLLLNKDKTSWDYTEPQLLEELGTDVKVKGYFKEYNFNESIKDNISKRVNELIEFGLDIGKGHIITKQIDEEDWANAWKKYFKPFKAGDKIVIKPTWEDYEIEQNEIIVEIDPGMAFGTGDHETTLMCLKLLESYVKKGDIVFDVGCGSGILGIAAGKLGAGKILCVDFDENACKVASENVAVNKMEHVVNVEKGNLLDIATDKADVIVANIIADIIIYFSKQASELIKSGGIFISSGIIKERRDDVIKELKNNKFSIIEVMEMGEWCAITAKRDSYA